MRRAGTRARAGHGVASSDQHGLDRHGVNGPELPSIGFGTGGLPGAGRAAGRRVPRIAFGTGGLPGAGQGGGRRVPRIAFGTGGLPGAGRAAGRRVPRIAFGTGGLPGAGRAAGRRVPRIAFGTGGLPGAGRAAGRRVPRIAFGTGGLPGAGRAAGRRVPRIAFGTGSLATGERTSQARRAAPRFRPVSSRSASGPWLAGPAVARGSLGLSVYLGGPLTSGGSGQLGPSGGRPARKGKQPTVRPQHVRIPGRAVAPAEDRPDERRAQAARSAAMAAAGRRPVHGLADREQANGVADDPGLAPAADRAVPDRGRAAARTGHAGLVPAGQDRRRVRGPGSSERVREVIEPSVRGPIVDDIGAPMVDSQSALVVSVSMPALWQQPDGAPPCCAGWPSCCTSGGTR